MRRVIALSLGCKLGAGYRVLVAGWLGLLLLLISCNDHLPVASEDTRLSFEMDWGTQLPSFTQNDTSLLLAYVSAADSSGHSLLVRGLRDGALYPPLVLDSGDNWFVNWADYPSIRLLGKDIVYHYLRYSGEGTYDYNIEYGISGTPLGTLHQDGVAAEHGFVSSALRSDDALQMTWLDGRHTKSGADAGAMNGHDHHSGGGAMSLRTVALGAGGRPTAESTEIDSRVCDCCGTSTVATDGLVMIAYRDRSEEEVRDISFVINDGDSWLQPATVHDDNWRIDGCPVNGPSLAANTAGDIAIAWFTGEADRPRIQFARYYENDTIFGDPLLVDDRQPLGRLSLKMDDDGTAYLLGLAAAPSRDSTILRLWSISPMDEVNHQDLATLSSARSTGFPHLVLFQDSLIYAYTELRGDSSRVVVKSLVVR